MADPVIEAAFIDMQRVSPGNGMHAKDDGIPGERHLRIRSIQHVSTERLWRRAEYLYHLLYTPEGLSLFDAPRRKLVQLGATLLAIRSELARRQQL